MRGVRRHARCQAVQTAMPRAAVMPGEIGSWWNATAIVVGVALAILIAVRGGAFRDQGTLRVGLFCIATSLVGITIGIAAKSDVPALDIILQRRPLMFVNVAIIWGLYGVAVTTIIGVQILVPRLRALFRRLKTRRAGRT